MGPKNRNWLAMLEHAAAVNSEVPVVVLVVVLLCVFVLGFSGRCRGEMLRASLVRNGQGLVNVHNTRYLR